jgi:hypothetical protein
MSNDDLGREYSEINQYARQSYQVVMTWFVFYVTQNYVAAGWLIKDKLSIAIPIGLFFCLQALLAFIAVGVVQQAFRAADRRLQEISSNPDGEVYVMRSPLPLGLYVGACHLMMATVVSLAALWLWLMYGRAA